MERLSFKIFVLLFLIFLAWPSMGCYSQNQKSVRVEKSGRPAVDDPNGWDFGQIKEGSSVQHEFVLKNNTDRVLIIKDITTSCGCTFSEAGRRELPPAEETVIEVKFDSTGYSGEVKQYVYVNTDNPDEPLIRYTIRAEVIE